MSQDRHEPFEELISASLHNELNPAERDHLNAHLDGCASCRETLAAFSDQRRIVAGLRHLPPPRDLHARIRTGIERGAGAAPWWRRPRAVLIGVGGGLALVAGAALGVLLMPDPGTPPVGQASATPSIEPLPGTASPVPTPPTSAGPSAAPSMDANPTQTPVASPEPEVFLALTGPVDNRALTVRDGPSGATLTEADSPPGEPIAAELSPDGQWLAYISAVGESGRNQVRAIRVSDPAAPGEPGTPSFIGLPIGVGETLVLGDSDAGSPFLEHLSWSSDSRYLAFTLAGPGGTDAWIWEVTRERSSRLTDVGNAYAGSWVTSGDGSALLWLSTAGDEPHSYLRLFHDDAGEIATVDPASGPYPAAENVFQPLVSPDGARVIFWSGRMQRVGNEWLFSEGGTSWLAENTAYSAAGYDFTDARQLFSDVTVGRDGFASAAITWGGDSDAFAVWDVAWTGVPQADGGSYPDRTEVYFGHASDPRGLTRYHAIDDADLPADAFVVDVKVSPTSRHLVITAAHPRAGLLDPPRADLLLVERNTGSVPDVVRELGSAADGWFGPAAFGGG